jgi:hypothetical protein
MNFLADIKNHCPSGVSRDVCYTMIKPIRGMAAGGQVE